MSRAALAIVVALAVWLGGAAAAHAYPHFQFSSGSTRCADCHHTPAGGGLLNEWGRGELGETLAMGGDGRFLHGVTLPPWLDAGGDLRLAGLVEDGGVEGARLAVFPMQVEGAVRIAAGGVAITGVVGLRSAARTAGDEAGGFGGLAPISREHFVSYQPEEASWYLRAGRFAPPFGLRLADHTAFVRRYLGHGLFEEPYAAGGGVVGDDGEVHVSLFAGDPLQWSRDGAIGVAAVAERRFGARAVLGSLRVSHATLDRRAVAGVGGKWWLEGAQILMMLELDGGWQDFPEAGAGRPFAAAWMGPTWFARRGVALTVALEAWAPDARIPELAQLALSPSLSVMPWAHVEVAASARLQQVGAGDRAEMAMLQLHYLP